VDHRQICDRCIDRRLTDAGINFDVLASCADALATEILRRQHPRKFAINDRIHR
jgi:hypothetical protein